MGSAHVFLLLLSWPFQSSKKKEVYTTHYSSVVLTQCQCLTEAADVNTSYSTSPMVWLGGLSLVVAFVVTVIRNNSC